MAHRIPIFFFNTDEGWNPSTKLQLPYPPSFTSSTTPFLLYRPHSRAISGSITRTAKSTSLSSSIDAFLPEHDITIFYFHLLLTPSLPALWPGMPRSPLTLPPLQPSLPSPSILLLCLQTYHYLCEKLLLKSLLLFQACPLCSPSPFFTVATATHGDYSYYSHYFNLYFVIITTNTKQILLLLYYSYYYH